MACSRAELETNRVLQNAQSAIIQGVLIFNDSRALATKHKVVILTLSDHLEEAGRLLHCSLTSGLQSLPNASLFPSMY